MCNCADDEIDPEQLLAPRPCPEVSPQDQAAQRRRGQQPCCGAAKRKLTYEDTLPNGGEHQQQQSPPQPPPTTPVQQCRPAIRRCELVGTAIVRRRIDCGTSPERRDSSSREVTATDRSKDTPTPEPAKEQPEKDADKSKEQRGESEKPDESIAAASQQTEETPSAIPQITVTPPTPEKPTEAAAAGEEKKPEGASATSTPCPGMQDPQKDCNCSTIPKT